MSRPDRTHAFDPSRLRLGSREEVSVGAYARRQLRRRILLGLFGALLIAGAVALYRELRPAGGTSEIGQYPVKVRCLSCGRTATLRVAAAQTFPIPCPKCGETACRPLWQCRDCGFQFVPEQNGGTRRCPKCGSQRVGSAAVEP